MKKMLVILILLPFLFSCGEEDDDDNNDNDKSSNFTARMDTVLGLAADTVNGKTFYAANCSSCHAVDGAGTDLGSDIRSENNARDVLQVVLDGAEGMPSYSDRGDQDLSDVTAYATSL